MKAIIMAGGSGTRLWPMSRTANPKQLQKLISDKTMIEDTFERLENVVGESNIYISTTDKYYNVTAKVLPQIKQDHFIVENVARNTGPAIGLITSYFYNQDPKSIIATIASDHVITKNDEFKQVLQVAEKVVEKDPQKIVVVGINPSAPETGFGYIKMNDLYANIDKVQIFNVEEFVEKPDLATAKKYLAKWEYLWNASYFIFRADTMLELFKVHQSKIYKLLQKIMVELKKPETDQKKINELYAQMPEESIDTGIIEKTKDVVVIPADLGWNDIGSWGSLHDVLTGITGSNVISKGHHIGVGDEGVLVYSKDKMIATVGLKDIVIVDTPDVTLVCSKEKSQEVKKLIEKLKEEGKHLYL